MVYRYYASLPRTREGSDSPYPLQMLFGIFQKMHRSIHHKVSNKEAGLYVSLVFPITTAFLITFSISRLISHIAPWLYVPILPDVRIHHYSYGILVLAFSGYLSLVFSGPRAKFWLALLYGFGLGLAFDEFAMWLRLRDDDPARWSYDGFLLVAGAFLFILSAKKGSKLLRFVWPFRRRGDKKTAPSEAI